MAGMLISDRLWIKSIYSSTADVLRADGVVAEPAIRTLADWVRIQSSVETFVWSGLSTVCPEAYPELMECINTEIASALEDCEWEITAEVRSRLAKSLDSVAWTGLGGE